MFYPVDTHSPIEPMMGAFFPHARLAEAWVPYQSLEMIFNPSVGLFHGTIFPELVRPYTPHPNIPDEVVYGR